MGSAVTSKEQPQTIRKLITQLIVPIVNRFNMIFLGKMFHADGNITHGLRLLNSNFMILFDAGRADLYWFFFANIDPEENIDKRSEPGSNTLE
jgi:hypothetical protein